MVCNMDFEKVKDECFACLPHVSRTQHYIQTSGGQRQLRSVVWSSAHPRRAYLPLKIAVSDKPGVTLILAMMMEAESDQPNPVTLTPTGERVMIKVIQTVRRQLAQHALAELAAMELVSYLSASADDAHTPVCCFPHTHVVGMYEAMRDEKHLYLILPYMNGGDLFEVVSRKGAGLHSTEARKYFVQVLKGLAYLRSRRVAHGDLSLENIMLSLTHKRDGTDAAAHLIDLGSSYVVDAHGIYDGDDYCFRGKPGYIPPEVANRDPTRPIDLHAVDVWALGVCLYVLLTGHPLYTSPEDQGFKVLCEGRTDRLLLHYASYGLVLDPLARDLITRMLHPDPALRIRLDEIIAHPWVSGQSAAPVASAVAATSASSSCYVSTPTHGCACACACGGVGVCGGACGYSKGPCSPAAYAYTTPHHHHTHYPAAVVAVTTPPTQLPSTPTHTHAHIHSHAAASHPPHPAAAAASMVICP